MANKEHGYWLKSGLINIIQNFTGVLFAVGSFYILVRLLSKHEFGAWTLFMSYTTILELIRGGLIQSALVKFLSSSVAEEHSKIFTASFIINTVLTILCVIINLLIGNTLSKLWNAPELTLLLYIYNISFILTGLQTQFNAVAYANLKYKGIFYSTFSRQFIFFIFLAVCLLLKIHINLVYLVYVQIVGILLGTLIAYGYVTSFLSINFNHCLDWIKKLLNYGKYTFGSSLSSMLSQTMDQMMLGAMISPVASGTYNIAVRITNLIEIPTSAVAVIVFPQSSKRMETQGKSSVKYLYEKSVGTILALVIPVVIFLYFFAQYIVRILADAKYDESIPLLKITLLYCLFVPFGRQAGTILQSIGKARATFFMVISTAVMNLGLNFIFIFYFGLIGAAYATLLSSFIGFVISQIYLKRILDVNLLNCLLYAFKFYPELYDKYVKGFSWRGRPTR